MDNAIAKEAIALIRDNAVDSEVPRIAATAAELAETSGLYALTNTSTPEEIGTALRRLNMLLDGASVETREAARTEAVRITRKIGWRAGTVDALLSPVARPSAEGKQGSTLALNDPEPWHEHVDGAALLNELADLFTRYVALPQGAASALALWTVFTYTHDAAAVSALLAIVSATKRCGKTTLLRMIGAVARRPLQASNITSAALFRAVERFRPTLLIDEADTFLQEQQELRGILNSGHTKAGAVVIRTVAAGDDYEARAFSTWSPEAVAMIGRLPDTLSDRAIEIRLRRRTRNEAVERLRLDRLQEHETLRRRAARWAADNMEMLRAADPAVPAHLNDRAADNWRPLFAIADRAGADWPALAREAARLLSGAGASDAEGDHGVQLLADLRALFGDTRHTMTSDEIVSALGRMEDRQWPEWRRDRPISPKQLASLLQPFGVRPVKVDSSKRGYKLEDLEESFARYLPPDESECAEPAVEQHTIPDRSGNGRISAERESRSANSELPVIPDLPPNYVERILLGDDA